MQAFSTRQLVKQAIGSRAQEEEDVPGLVVAFLMQFWFATLAVVIIWRRCTVGDAHAEAVLPYGACVALDEEPISIGLVVVTSLVLLVAADASCDLVLLVASVVDGFFGHGC